MSWRLETTPGGQAPIDTSPTSLFTVEGTAPRAIAGVWLHNTHGSNVDVTFWLVEDGGSTSNAKIILKQTVAAGVSAKADGLLNLTMSSGQELYHGASTASVVNVQAATRDT